MKKILLYGIDDATADFYQNVGETKDIAMVIVGDDALDVKISKLFEVGDDLNTRAEEFSDSYMIFQEMSVQELVDLLREFHKTGREFEGIKVMRTKTNEEWTLRALLTEAAKENVMTRKVLVLQELLKSCNSLDLSTMEMKDKQEFKEAIMTAFMYLKQGQYTEEQLDHVIAELGEGLKNARKLYN